ncbi:MAG: hypothetical protein ACSHUF_00590 [Candidatus Nasuia deltocephalinicola]
MNKKGRIFFKKKYNFLNLSLKNLIKKYIKRLRYLSILPYNFKHFKKI